MTKILSANTDTPNVIRGPNIGLKGEIRAILRNPDGSIAQDNGWVPNKILDAGLIYMGMESWNLVGHVGSSNAAVVTSQTGLQGWLGYDSGSTDIDSTTKGISPNWETYNISRWRFDAGVGTGTIREFGVGPYTSNFLTTRVLVSPDMVKSAVQVLDIYYKMTMWPDLNDYTGTINVVEDTVPVSYNVLCRGQRYGFYNPNIFGVRFGGFSGNIHKRWMDGDISAALDGYPSGTTTGGYPNYLGSGYVETGTYGQAFMDGADTAYKDVYIDASLDKGNISSGLGIRSAFLDWNVGNGWGCQYNRTSDSGRIQKDNTKIIQLNYRFSWTRL